MRATNPRGANSRNCRDASFAAEANSTGKSSSRQSSSGLRTASFMASCHEAYRGPANLGRTIGVVVDRIVIYFFANKGRARLLPRLIGSEWLSGSFALPFFTPCNISAEDQGYQQWAHTTAVIFAKDLRYKSTASHT